MQWVVNDKYCQTRIHESTELLDLKQWMQEMHCKCEVTINHCDPIFFIPIEERNKLPGCVGNIGPVGPRSYEELETWEKSRPISSSDRVNVMFRFIMSNEKAQKIKTHQLKTIPYISGETLKIWDIFNIKERMPYCCGVYKCEGFDRAYNAMKILKPNLTEKEFAQHNSCSSEKNNMWDIDLVKLELYHGSEDCIETYTDYELIDTGKSHVNLRLRMIDIPHNIEFIKAILSSQK
jgi:hypothetical protein